MNVQDAYTDWSGTYDTDHNQTRDLDAQVTREALAARHFRSVLELSCGTGKNTALLIGIAEHVCALDFSRGMLAQARRKIQSEWVGFTAADLTRPWPCRAQTADLVLGNLVLEHIEDLSFVFGEAARVLGDGGRLFISELHPFRQYRGSRANFQRGDLNVAIPVFVHHVSDFTGAAERSGLRLARFGECWDDDDRTKPPRLVTFEFEKTVGA